MPNSGLNPGTEETKERGRENELNYKLKAYRKRFGAVQTVESKAV